MICSPCSSGRHSECETDPCGDLTCDHFLCACECTGRDIEDGQGCWWIVSSDGGAVPCGKPVVGLAIIALDTLLACAEHAAMVSTPYWYCHDHGGIADHPTKDCDRSDALGCYTVPLYRERQQ